MKTTLFATRAALLGAVLCATAAVAADGPPGKPAKPIPTPEQFYEHSGFDGREAQLGAAVVEAIKKAGPTAGEGTKFSPAQVEMLGVATAKAIKTISNDTPYQHEMNDALVKAHLTQIQFAKDHNMLDQLIDHEVKTQLPMILRTGKMIRDGGSPELGMIALTERTACFYQLVQDYDRKGMSVRYKAPYGNVLAVTTKLGQHNMTEQEIYETYTMPLMKKQAEAMGMELEMSPWQADGWLTMTIRQPAKVAATN